LLSQIYLIIPTASLFTLFTQKNTINSSKIRKKSGKIGKNCRKLEKVLKGRKYSVLQTIGGKECSRLQTRLLAVIEGRQYSKLKTVREK